MPWNCILTLQRQLWKISCQQLFCRGWRISSDLLRTSPFAWFGIWKQLLLTRVLLLCGWAVLRKELSVNKTLCILLLCLSCFSSGFGWFFFFSSLFWFLGFWGWVFFFSIFYFFDQGLERKVLSHCLLLLFPSLFLFSKWKGWRYQWLSTEPVSNGDRKSVV